MTGAPNQQSTNDDCERLACHATLVGPEEVIGTYSLLQSLEGECSRQALQCYGDQFALWYRMLNVYAEAILGDHDFRDRGEQGIAAELRLMLATLAADTSKLALDACLTGYYVQAFVLLRPVLESWKQMAYVTLSASAARDMFGDDGSPPKVPDRKKINKTLRESTVHDKDFLEVQRVVNFLNDHAHPSGFSLGPLRYGANGATSLGTFFSDRMTVSVLDVGLFAGLVVLRELARWPGWGKASDPRHTTALTRLDLPAELIPTPIRDGGCVSCNLL